MQKEEKFRMILKNKSKRNGNIFFSIFRSFISEENRDLSNARGETWLIPEVREIIDSKIYFIRKINK